MKRRTFIQGITTGVALTLYSACPATNILFAQTHGSIKVWSAAKEEFIMVNKVVKTTQEWRQQLSSEQFHITREKGTERAFSGAYDKNKQEGVYQCVCCDQDLFHSKHKFDSEPVGRAIISQSPMRISCPRKIEGGSCSELKSSVVVATLTSATFLTMGHNRPDCVTVSTQPL